MTNILLALAALITPLEEQGFEVVSYDNNSVIMEKGDDRKYVIEGKVINLYKINDYTWSINTDEHPDNGINFIK